VAIIEGVQRGRNRRRMIAIAHRPWLIIPAAAVFLLLGFLGVRHYQHLSRIRWVRDQAIPEITRSLDSGEFVVASRLLRRANAILPDDLALAQIHRHISVTTSFVTNPPGAEVWATGYAPDDNGWIRLGVTPFVSGELPFGIYPPFPSTLPDPHAHHQRLVRFRMSGRGVSVSDASAPGCAGTG
jgi:hypothetical protein